MKKVDTNKGILKRASIISIIALILLATIPAPNSIVTGTTTVTIELSAGWNFESMPESISASDLALKSGHITSIVRMASDGYYISYIPSLGVTDFICELNEGIYIHSEADTNITFTISTLDGFISGDLFVSGNMILDKNLTVNGSMAVQGNFETNNLVVTDNLTISGNLTVNEDLAIGKDLSVNGNLTVGKNLTVGGLTVTYDITINGYLAVDRDVLVNGNITVMKDAIIYGNLTAGNFTVVNLTISEDLTINGDFTASGDAIIGGNLTVTNDIIINGNYTVTENLTVGGDLFVTGNITGLVLTNTANFIIFKDDTGIVYAKNGDTGAIDFQSTNASYVINSALAALPDNGFLVRSGKVVLREGTYFIDSTINIPYSTWFIGAGAKGGIQYGQTRLDWIGGASDVVSYNEPGVVSYYTARGGGIIGVGVDCNDNANVGMRMRKVWHTKIDDISIAHCNEAGLVIEATINADVYRFDIMDNNGDGIYLGSWGGYGNSWVKLHNGEIGNNGAGNYSVNIASGNAVISNTWFENTYDEPGHKHLFIDSTGVSDVNIYDNRFNSFGTLPTEGIRIEGGKVYMSDNHIYCGGRYNSSGVKIIGGYLTMNHNHFRNFGRSADGGGGLVIDGADSTQISNNRFEGMGGSGYGVYVAGGKRISISDNDFIYGGIGVASGVDHVKIDGNYISNVSQSEDYGIYTGGSYTSIANNIIHGELYTTRHGIWSAYGETGNKIIGNTLYNIGADLNNQYNGISVFGSGHQVIDNTVISDAARRTRYGIYAEDVSNTKIEGNYINGTASANIFFAGTNTYTTVIGNTLVDGTITPPIGASNIIKDNIGFVTENSGTTSPGTSIVVTHGLAGTPNQVIVTPLGQTNYYYVTNMNANDFTIISEASVAFNWNAIYKP